MTNKYILDSVKTYICNWFHRNSLPVLNVDVCYKTGTLAVKTWFPECEKCLPEGKEVGTIVVTNDFTKEYGVKLPSVNVTLKRNVFKSGRISHEYIAHYEIIDVKEKRVFIPNDDKIMFFKKLSLIKDCVFSFEQLINQKYEGALQIKNINTRNNLIRVAFDSDLEPITSSFSVTGILAEPNWEFTFKRVDECQSLRDPARIVCIYRLVNVRTTVFDTLRSDENNKHKPICDMTDSDKEKFKTNYMGVWIDDYVKDPTRVSVTVGNYTYDVVGDNTKESEYVKGFDLHTTDNNTSDPVNHPNHYEMVGPFESFDITVESLGIEGARYFCQGNIIKYQTRYKHKNGEEDLKKRHWYSRMDQMLAKCKTIEDYYKLKESEF